MFAHIRAYKDTLVQYLTQYNENVDWFDFINQQIINTVDSDMPDNPNIDTPATLRDIKILKLIRSRLWTDKQLMNIEQQLKCSRVDYNLYYTDLLGKWEVYSNDLIHFFPVYILDISPQTQLPEELINDIRLKIDVLQSILKLRGVESTVVDADILKGMDEPKYCIFSTGSVTYEDNKGLVTNDVNKLLIIDDYFNFAAKEFEDEFDRICLVIRCMLINPGEVEELVKLKFGILYTQPASIDFKLHSPYYSATFMDENGMID